jgi:hypothetical protein
LAATLRAHLRRRLQSPTASAEPSVLLWDFRGLRGAETRINRSGALATVRTLDVRVLDTVLEPLIGGRASPRIGMNIMGHARDGRSDMPLCVSWLSSGAGNLDRVFGALLRTVIGLELSEDQYGSLFRVHWSGRTVRPTSGRARDIGGYPYKD